MKRRLMNAIMTLACLMVCAGIAQADIKIKTKSTTGNTTTEQATYIKGKRQRTEMMNGMVITIMQCDLKRDLQLNPQTKTYMVNAYGQPTDGAKGAANQPKQQEQAQEKVTRGGVVTTIVNNKDTGERKQMFGYTARHIITTMVTSSSPDACYPNKTKMEIDAWYIDFAGGPDCNAQRSYQNYSQANNGGCQDRYDVKQLGVAIRGYQVWMKTTIFDESGNPSMSMQQETIEISEATLDAALFEAPPDYREVKDATELFSAAPNASASTGNNNNDSSNGDSALGASVKNANTQATNISASVGEKKSGVVRIGITQVKTGSVDERLNAAELAAAIQNTLVAYLKSPNVEVIQIEARLQSQVMLEAKQKECDFVIFAQASHKKGGGGFGGMFGKSAPVLGSVASMAGYGSHAGAVAGHVASTAIYTAASVSANVKSKDELSLEVKLQSPGGSSRLLPNNSRLKPNPMAKIFSRQSSNRPRKQSWTPQPDSK